MPVETNMPDYPYKATNETPDAGRHCILDRAHNTSVRMKIMRIYMCTTRKKEAPAIERIGVVRGKTVEETGGRAFTCQYLTQRPAPAQRPLGHLTREAMVSEIRLRTKRLEKGTALAVFDC